jgi:hypothetical protein
MGTREIRVYPAFDGMRIKRGTNRWSFRIRPRASAASCLGNEGIRIGTVEISEEVTDETRAICFPPPIPTKSRSLFGVDPH